MATQRSIGLDQLAVEVAEDSTSRTGREENSRRSGERFDVPVASARTPVPQKERHVLTLASGPSEERCHQCRSGAAT